MVKKQPPRTTRKEQRLRMTSAIFGGILLVFSVVVFGWLLLHQFGGPALPSLPLPGLSQATYPPVTQATPLSAIGITLGHPDQTPTLNQKQALLIANQLEPAAATNSRSMSIQYVLLNYPNKSTPAAHADFNATPAWMVLYQKIPLPPASASVDPAPAKRPFYDLYVFVDAQNGKELLAVQV